MDIIIKKPPTGGTIRAVGSKSIAERLILAWALSRTECGVTTYLRSDDVAAMSECAREIFSAVFNKKTEIERPLNVRESGATLRFIMPVVVALGLRAEIIMEGRLPERPLDPLIEQLELHGIIFDRTEPDRICIGGQLTGGIFEIPGDQSSQFVSGLLMALPLIADNSEVRVTGELQSRPYVDMTLDVLKKCGIMIFEDEPGNFYIPGCQEYRLEGEHVVEGDWSLAAFWLVLGACLKDDESITVSGLDPDSVQGDKAIIDVLKEMGADVNCKDDRVTVYGGNRLNGIMVDCRDIPDLVPPIVVAACIAEGKTTILNAERLRFKESDRIRSIISVLRELGVLVDERADGFEIFGGQPLKGGRVPAFRDHRIVMMAACLRGLCPEGPEGDIIIEGAEAVNKSYPEFFEDHRSLGGETEES
ncbi:MAG: 3-phosphoshikimate 1-carboxyvinyltransferase [Firmicutes bacterium]|nr:3-phosphoshikimate 1-carboxyvinyltransferase [Bacillota bacterium]